MIAWTFKNPKKKNIRNTTNFQGKVIKRYTKKKKWFARSAAESLYTLGVCDV